MAANDSTGWQAYDPTVKPPYIRFPRYPRLREAESRVLRGYLRDTGTENIERLRTAVPVGEGEVPGEPRDFRERSIKAQSQWKIDVVIDRPGHQEIIELKSRGTHTALGQLLAYDLSLGDRGDEPTQSQLLVVGFRVHPDLERIARILNIRVHTVPDSDPSGATRRFLQDRRRLQQ